MRRARDRRSRIGEEEEEEEEGEGREESTPGSAAADGRRCPTDDVAAEPPAAAAPPRISATRPEEPRQYMLPQQRPPVPHLHPSPRPILPLQSTLLSLQEYGRESRKGVPFLHLRAADREISELGRISRGFTGEDSEMHHAFRGALSVGPAGGCPRVPAIRHRCLPQHLPQAPQEALIFIQQRQQQRQQQQQRPCQWQQHSRTTSHCGAQHGDEGDIWGCFA